MICIRKLEDRVKASLVDSVIIIIIFISALTLYAHIGVDNQLIFLLIMSVIFFYEPILVSWRGCTIGHKIYNFRVIDAESTENINILKALIRFLLKSFLGIISLLFIIVSNNKQALHDIITNSIVINSNVSKDTIKANNLLNTFFSTD